MKFKEVTEQKGVLFTKKYKEEPDELTNILKGKVREKIHEQVFDLYDSVADNSKLIFLLASLILRLWNVNFDKNALSNNDKQLIEYALNKYANTTTRMDIQFNKEGIALIDKLLDRQKKIADIIMEVYNE